jgi:poly-gamma-glutamate capsule biosynthesis protein CapA/YwtB (metallophosphatase superfamily)
VPSRSRVAVLTAVLLFAGCGSSDDRGRAPAEAAPTSVPPDRFTLVATGDVLVHQDLELTAGAEQPGGGYDFSAVLAPVAPVIAAADLAVCHLETPVAPRGGPYSGYPSFAVQPEIVDALAGAGFDACSTASNHSLDAGTEGLVRTLDALDAAGIAHTGTARSEAEAQQPTIVDVAGVRVGLVAATYGLNGGGPEVDRSWQVSVADVPDVDGVLAAAARARAAGAEVVVTSLHCCVEYDHDPTEAQVAAVHTLLASPDVDLVLGHHAHVVQPFEQIDGEWVAYGLGNFVAQMARPGDTYDEVAARFTLTRGPDGRFRVTTAEAVPLHLDVLDGRVEVAPAGPEAFARVAGVLDRRGAVTAGLAVVPG